MIASPSVVPPAPVGSSLTCLLKDETLLDFVLYRRRQTLSAAESALSWGQVVVGRKKNIGRYVIDGQRRMRFAVVKLVRNWRSFIFGRSIPLDLAPQVPVSFD